MLLVKVLLLAIIIISTMTSTDRELTKKFNNEAIMFKFKPHPLPYYKYIAPLFDAQLNQRFINCLLQWALVGGVLRESPACDK